MSEPQFFGLLAVLGAGVLQGSFMLPMKWTGRWAWENTWLVFASTAYLLCPWLLVLAAMPRIFEIYGGVGAQTLFITIAFGFGWGLGAVTFGLGVAALGMALGFAVILGTSAMAGTLIPLAALPQAPWPAARTTLTACSLILMLAGVAVCSFAGKWKEGSAAAHDYRKDWCSASPRAAILVRHLGYGSGRTFTRRRTWLAADWRLSGWRCHLALSLKADSLWCARNGGCVRAVRGKRWA